jgi:hypothetical protein
MRRGRLVVGAAAVAGAAAFIVRRRRTAARHRADLYFDDGSMLSLDQEAPEADALFAAARSLVEEAR